MPTEISNLCHRELTSWGHTGQDAQVAHGTYRGLSKCKPLSLWGQKRLLATRLGTLAAPVDLCLTVYPLTGADWGSRAAQITPEALHPYPAFKASRYLQTRVFRKSSGPVSLPVFCLFVPSPQA